MRSWASSRCGEPSWPAEGSPPRARAERAHGHKGASVSPRRLRSPLLPPPPTPLTQRATQGQGTQGPGTRSAETRALLQERETRARAAATTSATASKSGGAFVSPAPSSSRSPSSRARRRATWLRGGAAWSSEETPRVWEAYGGRRARRAARAATTPRRASPATPRSGSTAAGSPKARPARTCAERPAIPRPGTAGADMRPELATFACILHMTARAEARGRARGKP